MATSILLLRSARLSASRCVLPETGRKASQRSLGRLFSSKTPLGDDLDLGTTNSSCAEGGKTDKVIENSQEAGTLKRGLLSGCDPSKLWLGRLATSPTNNLLRTKRRFCRDDPEAQSGPYRIVKGPNGDDVFVEAPMRMVPYKKVKGPNGDDVWVEACSPDQVREFLFGKSKEKES